MRPIDLSRIIGANVRYYREELGLTQSGLAEKALLSKVYVAQIETWKKSPSIEVITMLSDALEISPYQLLLDDDISPDEDEEMIDHASNIARITKKAVDKAIADYLKQHSKHRR